MENPKRQRRHTGQGPWDPRNNNVKSSQVFLVAYIIYLRLGAEEVSNLETPSTDKKGLQPKEQKRNSLAREKTITAPLQPNNRKDHDLIHTSKNRVGGLNFHLCQAVNRCPQSPAGWRQRRLSRELVISPPLGDNKAFLATPVQCQWRLCRDSNWASCTSQPGRHQWRPSVALNSHHVQ